MTPKQETFDRVARHLLTQRMRSAKPGTQGSRCLYRLGDLRCAIGVLIPDGEYTPKMEGGEPWTWGPDCYDDADQLVADCILVRGGHDSELCKHLQSVHDTCDVSTWAAKLRGVADLHRLSPHVVTEMESFPGGVASR